MGEYPLRATHGKVHIDDASDLRALMIADAAGQLGYQSAMTEVYPGDLWIDLLRSEPRFFNAVAPIVDEFLSDADARRREIGLRIVQKFPDARFAMALRAAFEREAALFVGVESSTGVGETLFRQWLEAMRLCGVKAPTELKRATALATPYLDLAKKGSSTS